MTTPNLGVANGPIGDAVTYEVHLAGHLDDHWSDWLGGHPLAHNDDATTTLTLKAIDQAQLHRVLTGIRDLGVKLLSVRTAAASNNSICTKSSRIASSTTPHPGA
jgi:hypothetical protein